MHGLCLHHGEGRLTVVRKDPTFPDPMGRDERDHEYWHEAQILRRAAIARKDLAVKAPLLWRATSGQQTALLGVTAVDRYAIVLWDSEVGRVGQIYVQGGLPAISPEEVLQKLLTRISADVLVGQDARPDLGKMSRSGQIPPLAGIATAKIDLTDTGCTAVPQPRRTLRRTRLSIHQECRCYSRQVGIRRHASSASMLIPDRSSRGGLGQ
jgi:hypothetical protein